MAYESKFKSDDIDELFKAILVLEDEEDCYRFFEDICTVNELYSIAQRLKVAKLLYQRETYEELPRLATTRVLRWTWQPRRSRFRLRRL